MAHWPTCLKAFLDNRKKANDRRRWFLSILNKPELLRDIGTDPHSARRLAGGLYSRWRQTWL
ncbi:hypothetical protein QFZ34_001273 [Phyllobacterium ifriqiyense]|uniref:DUF1127 domain-containing protein n=1 Tax=Phyllobacterium ifriqiyense TaxID=314238 RepID=A0ABU0S6E9_9HYPH|nr:hypothetical protein [Phyllobacterium ifriqiyense]